MPTVLFSVCRASCFFWEQVRSKVDPGLTAMRSPILTRVSRDFRLQAGRKTMKLESRGVSLVVKGIAEPYTVPARYNLKCYGLVVRVDTPSYTDMFPLTSLLVPVLC